MAPPPSDFFVNAGTCSIAYLREVLDAAFSDEEKISQICSMIEEAPAIHIFGFGRSGTAALALAIRLRHFSAYLPPVWWMGDQVREPVRKGDLVILFSGSGSRPEVNVVANKAKSVSAIIVLITANGQSSLANMSDLVFVLPKMKDAPVYGGGDFELGAYYMQEVLVDVLGASMDIPMAEVSRNHV